MTADNGGRTWKQLWLFEVGGEMLEEVEVVGHDDSFEEWHAEEKHGEEIVWKDAQMFYTVMAMFDFEADRRGWALNEIRFQRKGDGRVLAIMKASKGKRKVVAFVGGETFFDCWREIQETKRREGFLWKPDQYAKF